MSYVAKETTFEHKPASSQVQALNYFIIKYDSI